MSRLDIFPDTLMMEISELKAPERGVYMQLLMICHAKGGDIKDDDSRIAQQLGMHTNAWTKHREKMDDFLVARDGRLTVLHLVEKSLKRGVVLKTRNGNTPPVTPLDTPLVTQGVTPLDTPLVRSEKPLEINSEISPFPIPSPIPIQTVDDDDYARAETFFEKLQKATGSTMPLNLAVTESWKAQGLTEEIILHTVQAVVAKKKISADPDPPNSMAYFKPAMAAALKAINEPLPEVKNVQKNSNGHAGNRPPSNAESADAALARFLANQGLAACAQSG